MMHRTLTGTVLTAVLVVCAVDAEIPVAEGNRILFIGNSFTNNAGGLNTYVEMALADGPSPVTVTTDRNISFSQDVDYFWNESDAVNDIVTGNWDIVVLQGYWSGIDHPAGMLDTFNLYVDKFDSVITESGAQTVLMMPWAGNPTADWMTFLKYAQDSQKYRDNYRATGDRIGAPVAPCGWIWCTLVLDKPDDSWTDGFLYADDIHQNELGHYVNSYVFYSLFAESSPVGLDYHYTDVTNVTFSDSIRTVIQEHVWSEMADWLPSTPVRNTGIGLGASSVPSADVPTAAFDLRGRRLHDVHAGSCPGVRLLVGTRAVLQAQLLR